MGLLERSLQPRSLVQIGLDGTVLGKTGHLATLRCTSNPCKPGVVSRGITSLQHRVPRLKHGCSLLCTGHSEEHMQPPPANDWLLGRRHASLAASLAGFMA